MSKETPALPTFMLKNVRLCFPSLYRKGTFNGTENKDYDATFLLDLPTGEHKVLGAKIQKGVSAAIKNVLKGKSPKARYCAWKDDANRDIMENNREEYAGCYTLKAKIKTRPHTINMKREPLTEEDADAANAFYAGCRVNAKVQLNAYQSKEYGPIISFKLLVVQHVPADEEQENAQPFGASSPAFDEAIKGFDVEEDDDDIMGDLDDDEDEDL